MTAIFANDESGWSVLEADAFEKEEKLHDLVEEAPHLMPLAGAPRIVVLGREVTCGSGSADLLAIEDAGRPVVIEIKLAQNPEARRAVVAQVLSYASFLKGLSVDELDERLAPHLAKRGSTAATVAEFVEQSDQTTSFDAEEFRSSLESHLAEGSFRLVLVLDSAPADLTQLVGYLEAITHGRVEIDLVTVSAYHVSGTLLLVPQRVDPASDLAESPSRRRAAGGTAPKAITVRGHQEFMASIATAATAIRPELERLADWAVRLEKDGLATLYNSTGVDSSRWTLSPRVKGHDSGLAAVWNDNGAYLTVYRTVFERLAPTTLAALEHSVDIRQGNSVKQPSSDILATLREAYVEATGKKLAST